MSQPQTRAPFRRHSPRQCRRRRPHRHRRRYLHLARHQHHHLNPRRDHRRCLLRSPRHPHHCCPRHIPHLHRPSHRRHSRALCLRQSPRKSLQRLRLFSHHRSPVRVRPVLHPQFQHRLRTPVGASAASHLAGSCWLQQRHQLLCQPSSPTGSSIGCGFQHSTESRMPLPPLASTSTQVLLI